MRGGGFYWVNCYDRWTIAYYDPDTNGWYVNGLDLKYQDDYFQEIAEQIYKRQQPVKTRLAHIQDKIELLLNEEPQLKDNPKILEKVYWEKYDNMLIEGDWVNATPSESIRRSWRKLIETDKIKVSPKRKMKSIEAEQQYRKLYKPKD